jgi:hypothetical protein
MPAARGPSSSKVVIYFLPPFKAKPDCRINFGEAALINIESGWVEIAAKPDTRVDFGCVEHEGVPLTKDWKCLNGGFWNPVEEVCQNVPYCPPKGCPPQPAATDKRAPR